MKSANVQTFLVVLTSKLTDYDRQQCKRESKRGIPNMFRLGLLFAAKERVANDVSKILDRDDNEAMEVLKTSLRLRFNSNFAPATTIIRQIEKWQNGRKFPSLKSA